MEKTITLPNNLIPIKTFDGIVFMKIIKIICVIADGKHTLFYAIDRTKILRCVSPLKEIEQLLPSNFFFKCHRSYIINLQHLKKFDEAERKIYLSGNYEVTISKECVHDFLHYILKK